MENKSNTNILKLIIQATLIAMIGLFVPIAYVFFPTLFVTHSIKSNIGKSMGALCVVSVILGLLEGVNLGIMIFTLFGPMILLYNYMILSKRSVEATIIINAILFFISMGVVAYTQGITPETLKSQETMNAIKLLETNVIEKVGDIPEISNGAFVALYNKGLQLLPASMLIAALFTSYMTYRQTGYDLFKEKIIIIQPSSFAFFRLPSGVFLSGIIGITVIYMLKETLGIEFDIIMENMFIVYLALLFFEGLSLAKFLLMRLKVGPILQFIVFILMLSLNSLQLGMVIAGFLDLIFNFRKIPR